MIKRSALAGLLLASAFQACAGGENALSLCIPATIAAPKAPQAELFVVIDQTTLFDPALKQSVANNIRPFVKAGSAISVIQFSAYTQERYTDVLTHVALENKLDQDRRDEISKPILTRIDKCLNAQPAAAGKHVGLSLRQAFGGSSNKIEKSDVIASLQGISGMVKKSPAERKVVLIASDMLENSSVSSFYANSAVRLISPEKEIELAKKHNLIGDFSGAEVYVIGAGLLSDEAKKSYRSPQIMTALQSFWNNWFTISKASLRDFGQPALLSPIR
jgi:hypothetical protein